LIALQTAYLRAEDFLLDPCVLRDSLRASHSAMLIDLRLPPQDAGRWIDRLSFGSSHLEILSRVN
jgi:hypothetical protein